MSTASQTSQLKRLAGKLPWLRMLLVLADKVRITSKEEISEVDSTGTELDLWDSQRRLLVEVGTGFLNGQRTFYILKSRQLGVSTITILITILWLAVHPKLIGALVVDGEKNHAAFRDLIERYVASFPREVFGSAFRKLKHNAQYISFSNGSRLDYLIAGEKSETWGEGRGYAYSHLTEIGNYGKEKGLQSFIESMAQENPDRLFIFEGVGKPNHWMDMWHAAEDDPSICRVFIGWWAQPTNRIDHRDPRYAKFGRNPISGDEQKLVTAVATRFQHVITEEQLAWYRYRRTRQSTQSLDENQPWIPEQAFVLGGYNFFEPNKLQKAWRWIHEENNQERMLFKAYRYDLGTTFWDTKLVPIVTQAEIEHVELRVWQEPVKEAQYVIGMDPTFTREDWSANCAIQVLRCYADRLVQVAEYCSKRAETHQQAWILAHLAGAYRNCLVNIDLQGPGRMVMKQFDTVRDQLRQEVYSTRIDKLGWEDFLDNARYYLYHKPDSPGAGYVYNFESNWRSKWELMNLYRDYFTQDILEIRSLSLIEEMAGMIQEKNTIAPTAPGKLYDDRVFACAYACRTFKDWLEAILTASGAFYDTVTRRELGIPEGPQDMIDRLVYRWFEAKNAEPREEEPLRENRPWAVQRGFAV